MRPSRETDGLLLSSAWGAIWGGTLGSWLVAPALFASHRLHAQSVLDATVLVLVTTILLAILGAVLGIFGGFIPLAIETHAEGFRNRAWAYGLFLGPITVLAYVGDAILTHSISFRSAWSGATAYLDDLMVVLPAVALCLVATRRFLSEQRGTARLLKSAMVVAMAAFVLSAKW